MPLSLHPPRIRLHTFPEHSHYAGIRPEAVGDGTLEQAESRSGVTWGWAVPRFALVLALTLALLALPSASEAESSLERVQRTGVLRIGTDATYPPFENKVGDRIVGFDIDVGNEIARELGVRAEWQNINWDSIFPGLKAGKYDLVLSCVVITPERKKELAFSRPYLFSGQTIARRRGDTRINGPRDLLGKIVAVQQQTTGQFAVEKLGLPKENFHKFETMQDALLDVRNRRADAAVGDLPTFRDMIRKGYPELEIVGGAFVKEYNGVVLRPGEPELLAAVNEAIERIVADGRYQRAYEKWFEEKLPANFPTEFARVQGEGTPVEQRATGSAFTIRWGLLREAWPILLRGAGLTLWLTGLTLLFGAPLGLAIALARLSVVRPLAWVMVAYVEVIRGTPLLMQIFVVYFVLPAVGINLPPMTSAVLALSLNAAAYISEIFRAGIESIDAGQMEAARALGMDYTGAMRWVILPQTIRRVLPPMTNEAVALLKDSSLVSVVALSELMRTGRELASTSGSPVTVYLAVALLYLAMTLPLTWLVRRLEARWQPVSGRHRARAPKRA
jgi:His/Glu/Gln/Arg/opine family amino acid ABC transporter permease subunit